MPCKNKIIVGTVEIVRRSEGIRHGPCSGLGKHLNGSGRGDTWLRMCKKVDWLQHGDNAMKKILIVEDVEFNRDLVVQLLEDTYEVLTAADGATGIHLAARERPDLILMDLSLPIIDGWEATRRIKANAALQDI